MIDQCLNIPVGVRNQFRQLRIMWSCITLVAWKWEGLSKLQCVLLHPHKDIIYSSYLELDLCTMEPCVSGPKRYVFYALLKAC